MSEKAITVISYRPTPYVEMYINSDDVIRRISSDNITELKENEIFVFGSNLSGIHGAGGARTAMKWGAVLGQSYGLQGNTYAIPTKDRTIMFTLPIQTIKKYVDTFILFAKDNPRLDFLVTEIGCGLAGLNFSDVAPLFVNAISIRNIHLPKRFWKVLLQFDLDTIR